MSEYVKRRELEIRLTDIANRIDHRIDVVENHVDERVEGLRNPGVNAFVEADINSLEYRVKRLEDRPVSETFKVGDRVTVRKGQEDWTGTYDRTATGVVTVIDREGTAWVECGEDGDFWCTADELRHTDSDAQRIPVQKALDVDVTAYAGVIHTNASGERFHVIPEDDFLESEHWRHAFNVEERESLDMRQALDKANARAVELERALGGVTGCYCAAIDRAVEAEAKLADETHRADENERIWRANASGTKGDGVVVASLQKERDEARETAYDLAVALGSYREEVTRLTNRLADAHQERDNLITEARDMDQLEARLADARQERNELRSQVIELRVQLQRARSSQRIDPARAGLWRRESE